MATIVPPPEIAIFWELHVAPIVNLFCKGEYPLPEIQSRFIQNRDEMFKRHGIDKLPFTLTIAKDKNRTPLTCGVHHGMPNISFHIYGLMNGKEQLGDSTHGQRIFDASVASGLLHEMDHLALGYTGPTNDFFVNTRNEQFTWAATCEYTLRPMIEIHQKILAQGVMETYQTWVKFGRDVTNTKWRNYIRKLYPH